MATSVRNRSSRPETAASAFLFVFHDQNTNDRLGSFSLGASNVFHLVAFLWYTRVWAWHLTPDAAMLPGSKGFGWFFKYLTFWSFTLQLVQLGLCCSLFTVKGHKLRQRLQQWADDVSCAIFGLAGAVTIMYHVLEVTTRDMEEDGHIPRPAWLGAAVHVFNFVIACGDFVLAHPRSFSKRAEQLSLGITALYVSWILVCSYFNQSFPYPFLNKLPWPQGFVGIAFATVGLFFLLFRLGRLLSVPVNRLKLRLLPGHVQRANFAK